MPERIRQDLFERFPQSLRLRIMLSHLWEWPDTPPNGAEIKSPRCNMFACPRSPISCLSGKPSRRSHDSSACHVGTRKRRCDACVEMLFRRCLGVVLGVWWQGRAESGSNTCIGRGCCISNKPLATCYKRVVGLCCTWFSKCGLLLALIFVQHVAADAPEHAFSLMHIGQRRPTPTYASNKGGGGQGNRKSNGNKPPKHVPPTPRS